MSDYLQLLAQDKFAAVRSSIKNLLNETLVTDALHKLKSKNKNALNL